MAHAGILNTTGNEDCQTMEKLPGVQFHFVSPAALICRRAVSQQISGDEFETTAVERLLIAETLGKRA